MPHDDIPDSEPTEFTAGESWKWNRTLSDHPPSDGWTLKYALRGPTDQDFEASTASDGDYYEIREKPGTTSSVEAGTYSLVGFVEKGGSPPDEREIVYEGTLHVKADPTAAVNAKTHAETVLEAINAELEGTATKEQRQFTVNGREVRRWDVEDLLRLKNIYADKVRMERNPGQLSPGVEAHFRAP